jgi:hypothetical protein
MPEFDSSPNSGILVLENNLGNKLEDTWRACSSSRIDGSSAGAGCGDGSEGAGTGAP